jgi:hypothetical protein
MRYRASLRYIDDAFSDVRIEDTASPAMETCLVSETGGKKPTLIDSGCSAHIDAESVNRLSKDREDIPGQHGDEEYLPRPR